MVSRVQLEYTVITYDYPTTYTVHYYEYICSILYKFTYIMTCAIYRFTYMGMFLSELEFSLFTILTISWTLLINWALENPGFTSFRNSLHLQTSFFDFTLGSIPPGCFLRKAPTVSMQIYYTPGEEQMNNVDSFIQTGTSSIFRVESKFLFASLKDHSNCKPWPRRSVPPLCHT